MTSSTRTGGRAATHGVIPGRVALSVGRSNLPEPEGYRWTALEDVARLESGHTPSRSKPEYWDGSVPWIGIRDATGNHGKTIRTTSQMISQEGLDNSSARLLPAGTVCLSRTASVGYVVQMGVPMATSQDFVNWVCGPELSPEYLKYILLLEQESVRRFAHGSVHQTMYYPEAKALHALLPTRRVQDAIIAVLGALDDKTAANSRLVLSAERLMAALASSAASLAPLTELALQAKSQLRPESFDAWVAHFSLPAFDVDQRPERVPGGTIKSNKFVLESPCVLVSKLNPRFPRMWNVPALPDQMPLASTEFVVLRPLGIDVSELWSVLAQPAVATTLQGKVAGTSGSHQRVKPADVLGLQVRDPRSLSDTARGALVRLGLVAHARREESVTLAETRDALLPGLMSGKIRVKDAERVVGEAV